MESCLQDSRPSVKRLDRFPPQNQNDNHVTYTRHNHDDTVHAKAMRTGRDDVHTRTGHMFG